MNALISKVLGTKSVGRVDAIVASFKQTIDDLHATHEAHHAEAEDLGTRIAQLEVDRAHLAAEANRARTIARKLEGLLS